METTPSLSMEHGDMSAAIFPPLPTHCRNILALDEAMKCDRGDQILEISSIWVTAKCIRTFNMEIMIDGMW